MGPGNFSNGICLPDHKQVLDLSNVIFRVILGGTLDDKEVGWIRLMSEQRRANEVIVQGRNGLSWLNRAELHEWRFVLRFDHDGLAQIGLKIYCYIRPNAPMNNEAYLGYKLISFILLPIIIHQNTPHSKV